MSTLPDAALDVAELIGVPASIAEHGAKPFVNYGAKIAEHVEVPEALIRRPD